MRGSLTSPQQCRHQSSAALDLWAFGRHGYRHLHWKVRALDQPIGHPFHSIQYSTSELCLTLDFDSVIKQYRCLVATGRRIRHVLLVSLAAYPFECHPPSKLGRSRHRRDRRSP